MKNGEKLHMGILAFCHNNGIIIIICGPQKPKRTQNEGYQITQNFIPWVPLRNEYEIWPKKKTTNKWMPNKKKLLLWPKGSYLSKISILLLVVTIWSY